MAKKAIGIYLKDAIANGFSFIKRKFDSLKELNRNFHAQRTWIFESLNRKADYKRRLAKVLEVVKLHSCKHLGISYMTENHICAAYEAAHHASISKRTVHTLINHLRDLGFIDVIPTKREDGKQSANILVLKPMKTAKEAKAQARTATAPNGETPVDENASKQEEVAYKKPENLHTKKTPSFLKTQAKVIKERITKDRRLLNLIPDWFKGTINCITTTPSEVYEFWKVAKHISERTYGRYLTDEQCREAISLAIAEFYQSLKAATKGKFTMGNPYGFFHAVLNSEAGAYVRRLAAAARDGRSSWLAV